MSKISCQYFNYTIVREDTGSNLKPYLQFQLAFKHSINNINFYYPFDLCVFPDYDSSTPEIYLVPNKRI